MPSFAYLRGGNPTQGTYAQTGIARKCQLEYRNRLLYDGALRNLTKRLGIGMIALSALGNSLGLRSISVFGHTLISDITEREREITVWCIISLHNPAAYSSGC